MALDPFRCLAPVFILLFALLVGPVPAMLFNQFPTPFWHPFAHDVGKKTHHFEEPLSKEHCEAEELFNKDLDLVIYGATGYTGKLAAQYLAKGHRENPRWAIAGRDKMGIDYVYWYALGSNNSKPERIWHAALQNENKLLEIAKRTRAIVNFAGPFENNGCEALIRAALQGCAHYVDIAEETFWTAKMLKKYEATAKARGVAIVQSAGFSALASDFLVMTTMKDARKSKQEIPHNVVVVWTKFNDGVSGTQLWSVDNATFKYGVLKNPYILAPGVNEYQRVDVSIDGVKVGGVYNTQAVMKLDKWPIAQVDCPVIRRSLTTKYPETVRLQEGAHEDLIADRRKFLNDPARTPDSPTVAKFPRFGTGPPLWVTKYGSFAGMAIATTSTGKQLVTLEGKGSPSFMASAKLATELALGLAFHGPEGSIGGYLTPALALGVEYLESRLIAVDDGEFLNITHEH